MNKNLFQAFFLLATLAVFSSFAMADEEKVLAPSQSPSGVGQLTETNCPSPSDALSKPEKLVDTTPTPAKADSSTVAH